MKIKWTGVRTALDRADQTCREKYSGKARKACLAGVTLGSMIGSRKGIGAACERYSGKQNLACRDGAENVFNESPSGWMSGRKKKSRSKGRKARR